MNGTVGSTILGFTNPTLIYPAPVVAFVSRGANYAFIYPGGHREEVPVDGPLTEWARAHRIHLFRSPITVEAIGGPVLYAINEEDVIAGEMLDVVRSLAQRLEHWDGSPLIAMCIATFIGDTNSAKSFADMVQAELGRDHERIKLWQEATTVTDDGDSQAGPPRDGGVKEAGQGTFTRPREAGKTGSMRGTRRPLPSTVVGQSSGTAALAALAGDDTSSTLPKPYSFASFVYGPESLNAYRVAWAVANSPGTIYNPLYIQGAPGMGKTHLLKAIALHVSQRPDLHNVLYVPSETLCQELITSFRQHRPEAFRERYRSVGALLIDDLAMLADRIAVLEELTHTIDALCKANRQVVISGESDPAMIEGLPGRLRSRLTSGLVVRIGKPSLRTRLVLARTFAARSRTWFTEEALHLLAHRTAGGVSELETVVRRCVLLAPRGTVVGASMVKIVLRDLLRQAENAPMRGDVETILRAVCAEFGVTKDDLLSKKRGATISQARQIAMYLLREDAGLTVARIGRELERDHSTVLHACGHIETAIATSDESIISAISAVRENLFDALA